MKYEVRVTNVPDGAYDEQYLGVVDREIATLAEARTIVRRFRAEAKTHPENFEPGMDARILRLSDGAEVR